MVSNIQFTNDGDELSKADLLDIIHTQAEVMNDKDTEMVSLRQEIDEYQQSRIITREEYERLKNLYDIAQKQIADLERCLIEEKTNALKVSYGN
jgi:hypothetical protein